MAKTTALVMVSAILGITMIVLVGFATGHNSTLGSTGIGALSGALIGSGAYFLGKKKKGE